MLMPPAVFFLLKIALDIGVLLSFHMNFKMVYFQFCEWLYEGFHWYYIKSVNCFCWDGHFHNIYSSSLLTHRLSIFQCLPQLLQSFKVQFFPFICEVYYKVFICLFLCFYSSYWGGISSIISHCVLTDFMLISCLLFYVKYLSTVRVLWQSLGALFCVKFYHRQTGIL